MIRAAWFVLGWLAVAIGGIGIVIPGLPSTGFFILAAWCFSKCSPRFEQWILDLPGVGPLVRDYRAGLGMRKRAKIQANVMMWLAIGVSTILVLDSWPIRAVVVALGLVGSYWIIIRTPTNQTRQLV